MSSASTPARGLYPRFLGWVLGLALGMLALGWWPTDRWAGERGLEAMAAALVVSIAASALGGLPLAVAGGAGTGRRWEPHHVAAAALAGIGLRLLLAAGAGLALVASGRFASTPLLVWLGVSYVTLLAVDTLFALRVMAAGSATEK